MSLEAFTGYHVVCDNCEEPLEGDYVIVLSDPSEADDAVIGYDWKKIGGKHFCSSCIECPGLIESETRARMIQIKEELLIEENVQRHELELEYEELEDSLSGTIE